MTIARILGAAALCGATLLGPQAASAQQTIDSLGLTITTTPAATTDYLFRGISQTRSRPAIQLTVDAEHETGLYLGAFASNANFAGTNIRQELSFNFGYRFELAGVKLDLGGTYFGYPGYEKPPGGYEAAWWEATVRASYALDPVKLVGQFAWSPNFNFESGNAYYLEGGFDIALDFAITLSARYGYQWIERNFSSTEGSFGAPDYGVFSVSFSREIAHGFIGTLTGSYSDLSREDCFGGAKICGARAVLTLSRPF